MGELGHLGWASVLYPGFDRPYGVLGSTDVYAGIGAETSTKIGAKTPVGVESLQTTLQGKGQQVKAAECAALQVCGTECTCTQKTGFAQEVAKIDLLAVITLHSVYGERGAPDHHAATNYPLVPARVKVPVAREQVGT
jgi:hypothetical protein